MWDIADFFKMKKCNLFLYFNKDIYDAQIRMWHVQIFVDKGNQT